jgi:DNA-binding CsgD family transcriptional regulator
VVVRSPLIADGHWLVGPEDGLLVVLESPAWFAWLDAHTAFRYAGPAGQFAAHKQSVRPNAAYWQAFRKHAGKLHSVHLGRSSKLTAARLADAARALSPGPPRSPALPGEASSTATSAAFETTSFDVEGLRRAADAWPAPNRCQARDHDELCQQVADQNPTRSLSERELEVLRCVALGLSNQDVCRELGIALSTVKSHLSVTYRKLGVGSRTRALREAYALGLLTPGSS